MYYHIDKAAVGKGAHGAALRQERVATLPETVTTAL